MDLAFSITSLLQERRELLTSPGVRHSIHLLTVSPDGTTILQIFSRFLATPSTNSWHIAVHAGDGEDGIAGVL